MAAFQLIDAPILGAGLCWASIEILARVVNCPNIGLFGDAFAGAGECQFLQEAFDGLRRASCIHPGAVLFIDLENLSGPRREARRALPLRRQYCIPHG